MDIIQRKRGVQEKNQEKEVIILAMMTIISAAQHYYTQNFTTSRVIIRQPSPGRENTRRSFIYSLYRTDIDATEQLRMSRQAFLHLCKVLEEEGGLVRTRHVSITEAVAMFLYILAHNLKYRLMHKCLKRSIETISRQFHRVLLAIMKVSSRYIRRRDYVLNTPDVERWKWFENAIGALDGTHVPVNVPINIRSRYRNRKGTITTNVLGVCDPDLNFIYVLPGWEGSASDSRVLRDALTRRNRLHVPADKYYLVDAGYANGPGFLAPYRGTRYHLNEWKGNTPQNFKELFNLRHAKARNCVERIFGVVKKRWAILNGTFGFDIKTQIRIINATCVLHNFVRVEQAIDPILENQERQILDDVDHEIASQEPTTISESIQEEITHLRVTNEWTTFRDTLAMNMFEEYQARRAT